MKQRPLALMLALLAGVGLIASQASAATLSEQAASANASLAEGRTAEALAGYRALLASPQLFKKSSPELWCNLGLAEEKSGNLPAASLSLRRSLLLDPTLGTTRQALARVLLHLGIPAYSGWKERLAAAVAPEFLILGGALLGWAGLLWFVWILFSVKRSKGLLAAALCLSILGHGLSIAGTLADPRRTASKRAVVVIGNAPTLRSTPADSGSANGTLAPGTLITVLSRNGSWWYVSDGYGHSGWIPADTAIPLLPDIPASAKGS